MTSPCKPAPSWGVQGGVPPAEQEILPRIRILARGKPQAADSIQTALFPPSLFAARSRTVTRNASFEVANLSRRKPRSGIRHSPGHEPSVLSTNPAGLPGGWFGLATRGQPSEHRMPPACPADRSVFRYPEARPPARNSNLPGGEGICGRVVAGSRTIRGASPRDCLGKAALAGQNRDSPSKHVRQHPAPPPPTRVPSPPAPPVPKPSPTNSAS